MTRSKLETYYRERFGADDTSPETELRDDAPRPVRARSEPDRRRKRQGGLGIVRLLKLTLMLGPMALLLGMTFLTDCRGFAQHSWLPEMMRSGACARRELAGRVLSLDGSLRSLVSGIR